MSYYADIKDLVFTIFTPTFNRAHVLPRAYESLKRQTFKQFEWLIVDDGSTDDTKTVVKRWIEEDQIPIRYIQQVHGHKKKAHNRAVKEARGQFLLVLDSDDELLPNSLEVFYRAWMDIPETLRQKFYGVCGLCVDSHGRVVGDRFPEDTVYSNSLEMFYRFKVGGEKFGFGRVDILRNYPFPEDVNGYVPENVVWHRIAERYQTCFINQVVRVYHHDVESITRPRDRLQNIRRHAEGHALLARETLDHELSYFRYRPFWFLKMAANYTRFHLHLRRINYNKKYELRKRLSFILVIIMYPIGWLLYVLDSLNQKK
ncbi:MAG: glycosyl transferase [Patescibacteria group bacterium]|nr:MAG: glycosyl transferase [Patescibacteria group bacterium]